ncbi:zinc finger, CCHC-type containing protein [Tanacetum coccineum]
MVDAAMRHMASNFAKLDKFKGVDFKRWQKKMQFLLSSMSVVYVLTTPIPNDGDDATMKQLRKRAKRDNDDYVCRGLILKDFKHTLKHKKEELTLVELGSRLRIEESLKVQDNDKLKGNNVAAFMSTSKLNYSILWHARLGHVYFKRMQDMSKDGLIPTFDMDTENDLCDLHATPLLGNKKYFVTFIDDASRAVVRLLDPKLKTLGERGIECIFVGYAEHFKAFRIDSLQSLDQVSGFQMELKDIGGSVVPEEVTEEVVQQPKPELIKSKRNRTPKNFRPEFQLYLIEGTRDEVSGQHSYYFNVEDDPKTFDEAMNCKPLGCKWIFKRKLKVDGTIKKFNARLVLQGFKQKSMIDYFDAYAPVTRISTIRLLIAMASIHNLIIHQMDMKTAFLNGELEDKVYMNQPQGFIMPGNENKVCKLIKSLYGLKHAPKQWHQKFDEVVLSNGYLLNQANKCVYSKFNEFGKGVVICLYIDDMLIFDVILGIRIKHESNGISISQSHYIEKVLKKFNYFDCTSVSTPMDTSEKLMPNNGQAVSQLEYSRVIGCLMYAMTCTRSDIAFVMGKLSRYTSKPVLKGYTDASWINNTEDNSSTSGWVFLLGGGVIYWASKKQTCITGSIMEFEFVALAAAGKEAECAATLAKAYSQMYNRKSKHLGVRHNMIHKLSTNGVISIEFVRSQQNLADHLTKGLARDLVIKSVEGMGLNRLKHMYLHIIPRMCLEPAEKEDAVVNFLMVNFFEKVLSRSMNKEEPPIENLLKLGEDVEICALMRSQGHTVKKIGFGWVQECTTVRSVHLFSLTLLAG